MNQPNPAQTQPPDQRRLSRLAVASHRISIGAAVFSVASMVFHEMFRARINCDCPNGVVPTMDIALTLSAVLGVLAGLTIGLIAGVRLLVKRKSIRGWRYAASGLVVAFISALVGFVVYPNLTKYSFRCPHSEAKSNLRTMFSSLKASQSDRPDGSYPPTLGGTGLSVEPSRRYAYFYRDDVIQPDRPGHGPYSKWDFPPALVRYLDECKERDFVAVAIGNIDNDSNLDAWVIDNRNNLVNVYDDRCDETWSRENPCITQPGK